MPTRAACHFWRGRSWPLLTTRKGAHGWPAWEAQASDSRHLALLCTPKPGAETPSVHYAGGLVGSGCPGRCPPTCSTVGSGLSPSHPPQVPDSAAGWMWLADHCRRQPASPVGPPAPPVAGLSPPAAGTWPPPSYVPRGPHLAAPTGSSTSRCQRAAHL